MVYAFNPSIQEAEAGTSLWVWDQPGLQQIAFQDIQDSYTEKPCLEKEQQQKTLQVREN